MLRHLRFSHKLQTVFQKKRVTNNRVLNKTQLRWPAFSFLYWERCLITKMGYLGRQLGACTASTFLTHPTQKQWLGSAWSSTMLDLWSLPESPSFRASQMNRNTKRLRDTEEWPTDAQQNYGTKSLPALTVLPRFSLSLSVLFLPNFPHWQTE